MQLELSKRLRAALARVDDTGAWGENPLLPAFGAALRMCAAEVRALLAAPELAIAAIDGGAILTTS